MVAIPDRQNEGSADHWTIGLALDVSASMRASIRNPQAGRLATPSGILGALGTLLSEVQRLTGNLMASCTSLQRVRLFGYAFGLRMPDGTEICDLFRLMDISDNLDTNLVDGAELAEKYRSEIDALSSNLRSTFEKRATQNRLLLAKNVMGSRIDELRHLDQATAECRVREKIEEYIGGCIAVDVRMRAAAEIARGLGLSTDLTLTAENLIECWSRLSSRLSRANVFVGGSTSMRQALGVIYDRFERERKSGPVGSKELLFIVSDGNSSDGDPENERHRIANSGVTIISCLVASSDVLLPKELYSDFDYEWPSGARTMYRLASTVDPDGREANFLSKLSWQLGTRAIRLFAQINHSEVLNELDRELLSSIEREHPETRALEQAISARPEQADDRDETQDSSSQNLLRKLGMMLLRRRRNSQSGSSKPSQEEKRENLIRALTDQNEQVRMDAIDTLAELGDDWALEPLTEALVDPVSRVRRRAARALGNLHTPRAVPSLILALRDEDSGVISCAMGALPRLPFDLTIELLSKELYTDLAEKAASLLGESGDPRAVGPLIRLMQETHRDEWYLRARATSALGQLGDRRAVDLLIEVLKTDTGAIVRRQAAKSLGLLGDPRAIEPLAEGLCDLGLTESVFIRGTVDYAAEALVRFGALAVDAVLGVANRLIHNSTFAP